MITGDLDRALATPVSSAGTWRPGPRDGGDAPGTYATTVAFLLARRTSTVPARTGTGPVPDSTGLAPGHAGRAQADAGVAGRGSASAPAIAAALAGRLRGLTWVSEVAVTGGGYLTVTVTPEALAGLAVRITQAGPRCCRSDALAGMTVTAPAGVDLASAPAWAEARRRLAATVLGRLAEAAGARVTWTHDTERMAPPGSPAHPGASRRPATPELPGPGASSPVAEAMAFAGTGPVSYALACLAPHGAARLDARLLAAQDLRNPAYAVRYAHAHAASTLRQAADLGLGLGEAAEFQPRLLAHPSEQALLWELSWLPERVARAARRGRPDVLARFLGGLARTYLACQETCPAVWPGGAQDGWSSGAVTVARLWLAAATRTALRAGLDLLGVDAPDRM